MQSGINATLSDMGFRRLGSMGTEGHVLNW